MKIIAIVPARSGSKGLKDKNIIELCGRPLMWYTIKAAKESGLFDVVMVSTDSQKYAEVAKQCGAEVPFLRSAEQSKDTSGSWDVVREVLNEYEKKGMSFDYVALLQPTSPLRTSDDICDAMRLIKTGQANTVVSVTDVDHPVQWCFRMHEDGYIDELANSPYNHSRRQELERYFRENGAIYIVSARKIIERSYDFYGDKCYGKLMPRERSVDIDSAFDLMLAECILMNHIVTY